MEQRTYIDRAEAIKRIRAALKERSSNPWSVKGHRGTAYGWIDVNVPPREREEYGTMPEMARYELAALFGLDRPVHDQGLSISPDEREYYVAQVERT